MKDALTTQDSRIINKVLAITVRHQVAVIEGRPNEKAVLISLRQDVTAEEISAAIVVPGLTLTTVTSMMVHQVHLLVLLTHIRHLRLHGATSSIFMANIHTKILGQAR